MVASHLPKLHLKAQKHSVHPKLRSDSDAALQLAFSFSSTAVPLRYRSSSSASNCEKYIFSVIKYVQAFLFVCYRSNNRSKVSRENKDVCLFTKLQNCNCMELHIMVYTSIHSIFMFCIAASCTFIHTESSKARPWELDTKQLQHRRLQKQVLNANMTGMSSHCRVTVNPSIKFRTAYPIPGGRGGLSQLTSGKRQRTRRLTETVAHRHIYCLNPTCMSLGCGKKPELPKRIRERGSTQKGPGSRFGPRMWATWGDGPNHCTTVSPLLLW